MSRKKRAQKRPPSESCNSQLSIEKVWLPKTKRFQNLGFGNLSIPAGKKDLQKIPQLSVFTSTFSVQISYENISQIGTFNLQNRRDCCILRVLIDLFLSKKN